MADINKIYPGYGGLTPSVPSTLQKYVYESSPFKAPSTQIYEKSPMGVDISTMDEDNVMSIDYTDEPTPINRQKIETFVDPCTETRSQLVGCVRCRSNDYMNTLFELIAYILTGIFIIIIHK